MPWAIREAFFFLRFFVNTQLAENKSVLYLFLFYDYDQRFR